MKLIDGWFLMTKTWKYGRNLYRFRIFYRYLEGFTFRILIDWDFRNVWKTGLVPEDALGTSLLDSWRDQADDIYYLGLDGENIYLELVLNGNLIYGCWSEFREVLIFIKYECLWLSILVLNYKGIYKTKRS